MNEYFQAGSVPAPSSPGASSVMRQEFANIAAGFDKLPILAGHPNEIVVISPDGLRMETNGTLLTDFTTLTGVQELTNKTISWANNTFTGFGDAATKVAGTGAGEVLLLAEANKLPALDGSLLTNLDQGNLDTVSIAHGGTGGTTLGEAQANLGIDLKADAFNAVLTGAPTAPTPNTGDASARVATTYFVADTMQAIGAFGPSAMNPLMDGVASAGISSLGSRDDHVHPTDTTRAPLASPAFTGNPTAPTPTQGDNDTSVATTAFVNAEIAADRPYSNADPLMNGVAAQGSSPNLSRQDHVHPTDTTRAPLASPAFTGNPTAPTPLTTDNDTSLATTAFVQSLIAQQPPAGMQPSNSNPVMDGAASAGVGVEGSRYDHVHPSDTSRVAKSGDTMTGQLKGITPVSADDLTRKDYVDSASGARLIGTGPAFKAQAATQQTINPSSFTKVVLGNEIFDTNSCFTNNSFKPDVAGYYQINAGVRGVLTANAAYLAIGLAIYKNSTAYSETRAEMTPASSALWYNTAQLSDVVYLNGSTDSVSLYVRAEYAMYIGSSFYEHLTFLSGHLARAA